MDHFKTIYSSHASEYHRMIAVEDADGNLVTSLSQITDWSDALVLDLGSGTGRFPLMFKDFQTRFICLDLFLTMLLENRLQRDKADGKWPLVQGDMRTLPFPTGVFDIAIAGWSIGHLRAWYTDSWRMQIGLILKEMERAVKPEGMIIICETLSTGSLVPQPPTPELAEYFEWLEEKHNFSMEIIPTDYKFDTVEQAVEYTEFFFGSELSDQIRKNRWARLPEWTGIWYKTVRML